MAQKSILTIDVISTAILGSLGCDMEAFLRYFPAVETMYSIFVALAIGLILLNWVWQLFKNFGVGIGIEAEDPIKLSIRSVLFIFLAYFAKDITEIVLRIGKTPYYWIMTSEVPPLDFSSYFSIIMTSMSVSANGVAVIVALILTLVLAWNYLKLLLEAAERYVLLGVMVFTAPVAFAMGASRSTSNIFKSWCRMLGGQVFLILMNAWCLRVFSSMMGVFLSNPLSL